MSRNFQLKLTFYLTYNDFKNIAKKLYDNLILPVLNISKWFFAIFKDYYINLYIRSILKVY